jgi:acid phosphatase type 7
VKSLHPARFLAVGGLQYTFGSTPDYAAGYDRYFGSLKPITRPVPGPTDWSPDPSAYLDAFGKAAGPPDGSYSFDLGSWHIIALNSRTCFDDQGCGPGTRTYDWLSSDLATHPNSLYPCTLAYFHDPRFLWVDWWQKDGVAKGPEDRVAPLWAQLASDGVDVVVGANAHNYERWAPQDVNGTLDRHHGITEFVVGTGGKRLFPLGPLPRPANLVAAQDVAYGVLRMVLMDGGMTYAWRSAALQPTFADAGTVRCH